MSSNVPIGGASDFTAPTPQNTPLNQAPINLGLSRPTVPDISEEGEGDLNDDGPSMDDLKETMMGMVEGKLATLLGKSSGYIESLPVEVKLNVEALKGLQVKQNELHQKYKLECLELEKKVSFIVSIFRSCCLGMAGRLSPWHDTHVFHVITLIGATRTWILLFINRISDFSCILATIHNVFAQFRISGSFKMHFPEIANLLFFI